MKRKISGYSIFVIVVFFFFMLLHQTDKLLIGSLQVPISEAFGLDDFKWGLINSGALIVGTFLYPIWGYLYDRFARAKLLALASAIWGATTWISSIARTYPGFLATRASTGIDDSSYPGLYSLVADYFGPKDRSTVYGILQVTQPIGYLFGMILALMIAPLIGGWRSVFYLTGALGIIMAIVIFFGVKELPRGKAEPEFEGIEEIGQIKFSFKAVKEALKKKTMWFVFLQGFAGVFPWNVITYFFFGYLIRERNYDENAVLFTMGPVILILALGYYVGGFLGDRLFRKTPKGRILVSCFGVVMGAIFLYLALNTPVERNGLFFVFMSLTALFMPFASPNVLSTVYDITLPEVRSTAQSVEYFVENSGAALAPVITGAIIVATGNMKDAILSICTSTWILCFLLYLGALFFIDGDIKSLKVILVERAEQQKRAKA